MAAKTKFRGSFTALVTPFKNGSLDEAAFRALVNWQISEGTHGLVPVGTTGESPTLSHDEHNRVIEICVEEAAGKVPVIAGAGSNATQEAIALTRHAKSVGADAVLSVAPYYNKPTQEGLYQHFRTVAEAVAPLPVVLYNVPGRTSSNIAAETTLRLAREVENVAAVKEASGNLAQIMEIIRNRPEGFLVLSGDDAMTFALLALGGDGLISVASNEAPGPLSRMVDAALAGRWDEARELHYRWLPLMDVNFVESSPGPVKAAMTLMGLIEENLRLPLVPVTEKTRSRVREVLSELGLLEESTHVAA